MMETYIRVYRYAGWKRTCEFIGAHDGNDVNASCHLYCYFLLLSLLSFACAGSSCPFTHR